MDIHAPADMFSRRGDGALIPMAFPYGKFGFGTRLRALQTRTDILLFGRPRVGWPRAGLLDVGKMAAKIEFDCRDIAQELRRGAFNPWR